MGSDGSANEGLHKFFKRLVCSWCSLLCTGQYSSPWQSSSTSYSQLHCNCKSPTPCVSICGFSANCRKYH